jgi:acyl-coenzyme A thioesterase PaaI-like protein
MPNDSSPARLCFGCGSENSKGLAMQFDRDGDRSVAVFTAPKHLQGYPGRVHGGCIATMLDEAMGWASYHHGTWSMTARFTMRLRRAVPLDRPLTVAGWVEHDRGRFLEVRADLRLPDGTLLAEGDGLFARLHGEQAEELRQLYEGEAGAQTETITSASDSRE